MNWGKEIRQHYGHEIVVAQYSDIEGNPESYALECIDCWVVLLDDEDDREAAE